MNVPMLMDYEVDRLCEALRRDMRRESDLAHGCDGWAELHAMNARHDLSLLEALRPKHSPEPAPSRPLPLELTNEASK